jgi:hypothetical protein
MPSLNCGEMNRAYTIEQVKALLVREGMGSEVVARG